MRGKVAASCSPRFCNRITPAYAGKRLHQGRSHLLYQDHPRLCGEKVCRQGRGCGTRGSPPPMRGKETALGDGAKQGRITPAYAGKRLNYATSIFGWEDHPRLCGEKVHTEPLSREAAGSPPPMRGKVSKCPPVDFFHRITPAYAGKRILQRLQGCKL